MARRQQPPQTPFGAWLTAWLEEHDWTVQAFAKATGVSPAAVSLWKTKTKRLTIDHLEAVAAATGESSENLQRMVYSGRAPMAPRNTAPAEELRAAIREERPEWVDELLKEVRRLREAPAPAPTPVPRPVDGFSPWRVFIRLGRQARGLSVGALAAKMGVNTRTVEAWEEGTSVPPLRQQGRLIGMLVGVEPEQQRKRRTA